MPKVRDLVAYDESDYRAIQSSGNLDANESLFFARQLEYLRPQAYQATRIPLSALALIPISTDVPAGAKTHTYRVWDTVGMAKIISNYADDLPRAGVSAKEFTNPIRSIGVSYGYSFQDIRAAQYAGVNLTNAEQMAAKRAHDEFINKLAWNGDTVSGLPGFLSNPNLTAYTIPADGTGSSKLWVNKTPDQILRDMNGIINTVITTSSGIHRPNELWLPLANFTYVNSTIRGSFSDATILEIFLKSNPGVTVKTVIELTGAGSGGVNRMVALENSKDNFKMEIPMSFYQHPPQLRNLEFTVPCESRFGGVVVEFPLAFAYGDGL